jgi:energy-coupling factor transport system ATP-binding protein
MTLRVNDLSFAYPPRLEPLITGMELTIESTSWVAVIGPDGSGKTTLGKLIKGLLKPDSGSIRLDSLESSTAVEVGYVGGDPYDSFVGTSVEEDIVFGLENLQLSAPEIKRRLNLALGWTGLIGKEQRLIQSLSGGEQQKVALAGILAMGARVVVLDEALGMLDRVSRIAIRSLLNTLRFDLGLTILEITQDLEDALPCERILFLADGAIVFDGTGQDFVASPLGTSWLGMAFGLSGLLGALNKSGIAIKGSVLRSQLSHTLNININ